MLIGPQQTRIGAEGLENSGPVSSRGWECVARAAGVRGVDIDGLCAYCNSWLRCMVCHGGRSWENNGDSETGLIRLAAR